jgi:hypothetical protein
MIMLGRDIKPKFPRLRLSKPLLDTVIINCDIERDLQQYNIKENRKG